MHSLSECTVPAKPILQISVRCLSLSSCHEQPLDYVAVGHPSQSDRKLLSRHHSEQLAQTLVVADEALRKTVLPGGVPSYQK